MVAARTPRPNSQRTVGHAGNVLVARTRDQLFVSRAAVLPSLLSVRPPFLAVFDAGLVALWPRTCRRHTAGVKLLFIRKQLSFHSEP